MLTRSRTMAAPEAADEIARMERVSDTPRPTTAPNADPTFGSLIEKQPVTSGDSSIGSIDQRITNTIATNHEASPGSPVLASSALEPATVASGVVPQLLPTRAGMLVKLTSTTTVASDCNIYTGIPRPTTAVAESNCLIPPCRLQ